MNAWYFTFEYPPDFGGGLSEYMRQITDFYLKNKTQSLAIFAVSHSIDGLYQEEWLAANILLIRINPRKSWQGDEFGEWVSTSLQFSRIAELLASRAGGLFARLGRPSFLEFADGFGIGYVTIQNQLCLNRYLKDIPIVVTAHTPTYFIDRLDQRPIYRLPAYWHGTMERWCMLACDGLVSPSQALLDELKPDLLTDLPRHAVIPNPYELPPPEATPVPGTGYDHVYIASRLTYWKGIEHAIRGMSLLWEQGIQTPLKIYGSDTHFSPSGGSYLAFLKSRFSQYFSDGLIIYEGLRPRSYIEQQARSAYAQLHTSVFDNFPYSLLQAMGREQICVAGQRGGIREITQDRKSIYLCDVESPRSVADAVSQVMQLTPAERAAVGTAGRTEVAEHCDPGKFFAAKSAFVETLSTSRTHFPFSLPSKESGRARRGHIEQNGPRLSVVIPYFNMHEFIDETLASIRNNHLADCEVILVNDGSTSPHALAKLDGIHRRHGLGPDFLRIFNVPNGGVATARNFGADQARGRYLTLLDADDRVSPAYYEQATAILDHYENVAFVGCWIEDFNESGRIRHWATSNAEPPLQIVMNQTNCQSLVYRREVFIEFGKHDPDLRMFLDDWEGVIKLIANGQYGMMIPKALFEYRIRSNSIFRTKANLWDLNFEKITSKHKALYDRWGAELVAFLNANGPNNFYHVAGKPSALQK